MLRAAVVLAFTAALLPLALAAQSPGGGCALELESPRGTDAAYRTRDDGRRCEGLFVQPVAASTQLFLRGFHSGAPAYDLDKARTLTVEVVGLRGEGGSLVARSMRPRHFYQMDTRALDASGRFVWDTEILRHPDVRGVAPHELAVLYSVEGGDEGGRLVWPVRVLGEGADPGPPIPYLLLESERELVSVIVRVDRSGTGDSIERRTIDRRFPADYPIEIPLRVPEPGRYDVSLTAVGPYGARARTAFVAVIPSATVDEGG